MSFHPLDGYKNIILFSMLQQRLEFDFCSKADLIFSLKVIEYACEL